MSFPALANQKKDVRVIKNKIKKEKRKLAEVESREKSILEELKRFELRFVEITSDLRMEKSKLKTVQKKVDQVQNNLKKTQVRKNKIDQEVSSQIQSLYKYGKPGDAMQALQFEAPQWSRRSDRVFKLWFENNYQVLLENEVLLKKLKVQKIELQEQQKQKKSIVSRLYAKQLQLKKERKKKDKLLDRVTHQKDFYQKNILELRQAEKKMSTFIRSVKSKSNDRFSKLKGELPYPVKGRVFENYGSYFDKKLKVKLYRKGIRVRAKRGAEVTAIHDGRVAYAGWFDGYGNVVILDHGGGYFSLYAHLGTVFKDKNQLAVVGDVIGFVGDSGTVFGPHLYFELRQKGLTINPRHWLE